MVADDYHEGHPLIFYVAGEPMFVYRTFSSASCPSALLGVVSLSNQCFIDKGRA
jgi:hypothetical protein